MKDTMKPTLSIILMFIGILVGVIVLIGRDNPPASSGKYPIDIPAVLPLPTPAVSMEKGRLSTAWDKFLDMMKIKSKLRVLMQKDSLGRQDSLNIKAIDQQLNQLFYD